jgi:hypothetical protein
MLSIGVEDVLSQYAEAHAGLNDAAKRGLRQLLQAVAEDADITDYRWAAYMLATVRHECANQWQPIEEFGRGKGRKYGLPVTVTDANEEAYTNVYYGRGYVQLTWRDNYLAIGHAVGLADGLMLHPELALEPMHAYKIMSYGMRHGSFTGKKLGDYISGTKCDYVNARRVINALDRAELIARYARQFESLLKPAQGEKEESATTSA